jgi:hypothetical protein
MTSQGTVHGLASNEADWAFQVNWDGFRAIVLTDVLALGLTRPRLRALSASDRFDGDGPS